MWSVFLKSKPLGNYFWNFTRLLNLEGEFYLKSFILEPISRSNFLTVRTFGGKIRNKRTTSHKPNPNVSKMADDNFACVFWPLNFYRHFHSVLSVEFIPPIFRLLFLPFVHLEFIFEFYFRIILSFKAISTNKSGIFRRISRWGAIIKYFKINFWIFWREYFSLITWCDK